MEKETWIGSLCHTLKPLMGETYGVRNGKMPMSMGRTASRKKWGISKDVMGNMAGEKKRLGDQILGGMGDKGWR